MGTKQLTNNPLRRDELRLKMLLHFNTQYGQPSLGLATREIFEGYSEDEVKLMLYSLDVVGLIQNVNGKSTSGAIYQTTPLGRTVIDAAKCGCLI